LLIILVGVFVIPVLGVSDIVLVKKVFGLAVIVLAGFPFALAGHYEMYNRHTKRSMRYFPRQEQVVGGIVIAAAIAYVLVAAIKQ